MMKKILFTLLLLGIKAFKGANHRSPKSLLELARLKASLMYIKSIETARLLFVSVLGIGICLVLLSTSLILFHTTLFVYTPLSAEVKMWIGFAFAFVYFAVAVKAFSVVFSESQWLKIFHAADVMDKVTAAPEEESVAKSFQRTAKSPYKESGFRN